MWKGKTLGFRWRVQNGSLVLTRRKNGKPREVPLTPEAAALLPTAAWLRPRTRTSSFAGPTAGGDSAELRQGAEGCSGCGRPPMAQSPRPAPRSGEPVSGGRGHVARASSPWRLVLPRACRAVLESESGAHPRDTLAGSPADRRSGRGVQHECIGRLGLHPRKAQEPWPLGCSHRTASASPGSRRVMADSWLLSTSQTPSQPPGRCCLSMICRSISSQASTQPAASRPSPTP